MKRIITLTVLAFSAIAIMAFSGLHNKPAETHTADEIINDYITAMGGMQKLASINTIYMEGIIDNGNGRKIPTRRWIVNKKNFRSETTVSGITSFTIIRKDSGWNFSPNRGQRAPEPMTASAVTANQPNLDIEGPLVNYKAKGYKVTYEGTDEIEGTEAYKITAALNDSLVKTFYVDPDSHFVMRVKTRSKANGRVSVSSTDYSNYTKTADGYIFPMAMGNIKYTVIKVNTEINENLFKPTK
jgi:hypothetical protein